jgi:hypothetical protein
MREITFLDLEIQGQAEQLANGYVELVKIADGNSDHAYGACIAHPNDPKKLGGLMVAVNVDRLKELDPMVQAAIQVLMKHHFH